MFTVYCSKYECLLLLSWIQDKDYCDPDTGEMFDKAALDAELVKFEKPAGIANPKDFRNEVTQFVLRARANNEGQSPDWTSYEKLREVIEKKMFSNTEELLPVISFAKKQSNDEEEKHENFVQRMLDKGYTRSLNMTTHPHRSRYFRLKTIFHDFIP